MRQDPRHLAGCPRPLPRLATQTLLHLCSLKEFDNPGPFSYRRKSGGSHTSPEIKMGQPRLHWSAVQPQAQTPSLVGLGKQQFLNPKVKVPPGDGTANPSNPASSPLPQQATPPLISGETQLSSLRPGLCLGTSRWVRYLCGCPIPPPTHTPQHGLATVCHRGQRKGGRPLPGTSKVLGCQVRLERRIREG